MTNTVEFPVPPSGSAPGAATGRGMLASPSPSPSPSTSTSGPGRKPAVVLLQEWWGVNSHIENLCTRMAAEGFVVLAPDLYHGAVARNAEDAGKLMNALDWDLALREIAGAVEFLRNHEETNGKVGVMGFCMGGALTFGAACRIKGLGAAVPFYGLPPSAYAQWSDVDAPILAHFAQQDDWAKASAAEEVRSILKAQGKAMDLHVYDASHAFVNDTRPDVHHPQAAALAWQRTVAFFQKHLSS